MCFFRKFPKITILADTMCAWRLVKIVGGTMRGPHGTAYRPSLAAGDGAQSAGYGQKIEIHEMFALESSNPLNMILACCDAKTGVCV